MTDLKYMLIQIRMVIGIKLLSAALTMWPEDWGKRELAEMIHQFVGDDFE